MTIKPFPKGERPSHPLADLFPPLTDDALKALADDIAAHGLHDGITVLASSGEIVDGRHRYKACIAAGLDPDDRLEIWPGDETDEAGLAAWVIGRNLHRRHLTTSQRAMVAAKLSGLKRGRPRLLGRSARGEPPLGKIRKFADLKSRDEAAGLLKVSPRAVDTAKKIVDDGSDKLQAAVRDGTVSAHMAEAIAKLPKAEQDAALALGEKGIREAAKKIRLGQQEERRHKRLAKAEEKAKRNVPLSDVTKTGRRYVAIYMDPAWEDQVWDATTGMEKGAGNHYPTQTMAELRALPVADLAADDCCLGMWTTGSRLADAIALMTHYGFEYRSCFVWDKVDPGTGRWVIDDAEILLLGIKGDMPMPKPGTQARRMHREKKGPHSAKPAYFRQILDRYFPGVAKIELNHRGPAPVGWDTWGNETIHVEPLGARSAAVAPAEGRENTSTPETEVGDKKLPPLRKGATGAIPARDSSSPASAGGTEDLLDIPAFLVRRPPSLFEQVTGIRRRAETEDGGAP